MTEFLRNVSRSALTLFLVLKDARSTFEKTIQEAGWNFFLMAGEIKATGCGFDQHKVLLAALKRLTANVKSQHCNSIEITRVIGKSFLRVPYVSVSAHLRHLQKGMLFSGYGELRSGNCLTDSI